MAGLQPLRNSPRSRPIALKRHPILFGIKCQYCAGRKNLYRGERCVVVEVVPECKELRQSLPVEIAADFGVGEEAENARGKCETVMRLGVIYGTRAESIADDRKRLFG